MLMILGMNRAPDRASSSSRPTCQQQGSNGEGINHCLTRKYPCRRLANVRTVKVHANTSNKGFGMFFRQAGIRTRSARLSGGHAGINALLQSLLAHPTLVRVQINHVHFGRHIL
jgi:hypothetical protein